VTFDNTGPVLAWENGTFLRAGRPHRILSGSLHYFRVHPDLWSDRLRRLAAMGLNTVDTYVAWNFHEYKEGDVSFDEWRDLPRFIALAADHGLDVIVRPGPYICAEWDNGGLPAWLTARCAVPRSSDSVFTEAVAAWFDQLLPQITDLQASAGGPIVAVQLENEYGSYGDDHEYLGWRQPRWLDPATHRDQLRFRCSDR
jgi:beta-galactosidase